MNHQKLAEDRLAQLAAIARIGAEPSRDVLAIIAGKQPSPEAGTSGTSTAYHETSDSLRRGLMTDARHWGRVRERLSPQVGKSPGLAPDDAARLVSDAYFAAASASQYAYLLSAMLGYAATAFGPQTARQFASLADNLLNNGDDRDLNADVEPGLPLPPPTPAEQAAAGQLALDDEDPHRA